MGDATQALPPTNGLTIEDKYVIMRRWVSVLVHLTRLSTAAAESICTRENELTFLPINQTFARWASPLEAIECDPSLACCAPCTRVNAVRMQTRRRQLRRRLVWPDPFVLSLHVVR
jgi:hypothetical protein